MATPTINQNPQIKYSKTKAFTRDLICPKCGATSTRRPGLILMINECGHSLCNDCVELTFQTGQGRCYNCNSIIKKQHFRTQIFEESIVDKEIHIRKKTLRIYNKQLNDFTGEDDYNDYLEEIEEIVHNLTNNINLEQTKSKISSYEKKNSDNIRLNNSRKARKMKDLKNKIIYIDKLEKSITENFIKQDKDLLQKKMTESTDKVELIDKISNMSTNSDVKTIISRHKEDMDRVKIEENVNVLQEIQNNEISNQPNHIISRKTFRAFRTGENADEIVDLPEDNNWNWEYKNLEMQISNSLNLLNREQIGNAGYAEFIDPRIVQNLDKWSLNSTDLVVIAQRQLNDAFNCL